MTLVSRFNDEGLTFLTKTLPKLGRALDQGLVCGRFNIPNGFKRSHRSASTPAFMQAYFNLVFDEHGSVLDGASPEAVKHLRQVFYFAYKLELPYAEADEARVIANFVATEVEVQSNDLVTADELIVIAAHLTSEVFDGFDHKDISPQHGPGAVATGERLEEKWKFHRLYDRIHQVYPYYDYYVIGGARELTDRLDWYRSLERRASGTAKVVLVPKDSRGPRLISCEPLEYQWIQQGLGRKLALHLEFGSPITRRRVNFTRQDINRSLAQTSSASQRYATLDLKDASDRVSLELVRRIFEYSPQLARALEACRTTATKLPDGREITLQKYAPMGSALCFPVEAYIFWVVIVAAVMSGKNAPLHVVGKSVYVYGDDIIVPVEWAELSIQALESVGLRVNRDKSCITGKFRESCGMDAYNGVEVTPIRLKTRWSNQNHDGACLASYTAIANKMASRGYTSVANLLWFELERVYGKIPYGTVRASYPCRLVASPSIAISKNRENFRLRVNKRFQQVEFLLPSLSSRRSRSKLDGWPRLLRDIVTPPVGDPSSVVIPRSTKIKRRWTSVA